MVPNWFTLNTLLGEELEKARESFWRSLVGKVYHFKVEMHSHMVISLPLSNVSNCWYERQGFRKMTNQIVYYFCLWIIVWKKKEKETRRVTASSTAGILVTLISACIFSLLFSVHFSWYWWWEFVEQTRFHFHFSHDLYVWLSSVTVRTVLLLNILKDKSWNFLVQCSKHQSGQCF